MHLAFEHGRLAGRAQALAVHHPHAAPAGLVGGANKLRQRLPRLFAPQTVQIQLALNTPATAAQFANHVRAHARAAKAQGVVGVQQGVHVEFVRDGFAHHRLLIELMLHRHRRGWRQQQQRFLPRQMFWRQRIHRSDDSGKQFFFDLQLARCHAPGGLQFGSQPGARFDLQLQGPQSLEIFENGGGRRFHGGNFRAIPTRPSRPPACW